MKDQCTQCHEPLVTITITSTRHPDAGKTFAACPTHGAAYEL